MLASLDLASDIASSGVDVGGAFAANLNVIVAVVLPVLFAIFVWKLIRGSLFG